MRTSGIKLAFGTARTIKLETIALPIANFNYRRLHVTAALSAQHMTVCREHRPLLLMGRRVAILVTPLGTLRR
jgi:hypothetical protein